MRVGLGVFMALLWLNLSVLAAPRDHDRDNSREALIKLDSGSEKEKDSSAGSVSDGTKREVERQRVQREARKKRQQENREKRKKRLDEMNSRIRRKDLRKSLVSQFWVIILALVMVCGCLYAFNDLTIIMVSLFGRYLGMDVDTFVKTRRKISRANTNSLSLWLSSLFGGGARHGSVSASLSSGNLSNASLGSTAGGSGIGSAGSGSGSSTGSSTSSSGGGSGLGTWFGRSKAHFKNSEDPGDEESGYRGKLVFTANK